MKAEHELKLDRSKMSMLRWICGFNLKDNKKNTEVTELPEPVSLSIKRSRLL